MGASRRHCKAAADGSDLQLLMIGFGGAGLCSSCLGRSNVGVGRLPLILLVDRDVGLGVE